MRTQVNRRAAIWARPAYELELQISLSLSLSLSRARLLAKAHAKSRNSVEDAERRAKIAAAKLGKKCPPHVLRALLKANIGRKPSPETRRKISVAHFRPGARPPWLKSAWKASEDELVRSLPPAEAARQTGRTMSAVLSRRHRLKINDGRTTGHRKKKLFLDSRPRDGIHRHYRGPRM